MLQERGSGLGFFGAGRGCMEEKEVLIERNVVMVYCVVLQRWSGRQGWRGEAVPGRPFLADSRIAAGFLFAFCEGTLSRA